MLGAGVGFVAGFASGWLARGRVDSSRGAAVSIVATYFKAVERVKRIVAIEREHLEDLVAEGRARFELDSGPRPRRPHAARELAPGRRPARARGVTSGAESAVPRENLELAHHHPGRLRVRADALIDALDVVQRIARPSTPSPASSSVRYTAQTGSILVEYEPGLADADDIILRIADAADLAPPLDEATLRERRARPALLAIGASRELNKLTEEITGGRADLRSIVPAALAGLAIYSFIEEKNRMPRWDNLLYWGFNIFTMLHRREIDEEPGRAPARAAE